jgi:hypothetical protein
MLVRVRRVQMLVQVAVTLHIRECSAHFPLTSIYSSPNFFECHHLLLQVLLEVEAQRLNLQKDRPSRQ